ncbi:hypothetical protein [Anaerocolumna xylanovorans]|uniref:Lipoprotein n=1 Tax=Anaerocolumna xylanovorans DSM 12503 TaxID=1121345 RepID=A0A1M7YNA3_9FIRM|nr:hypothetical protein [Anaerocolumna xylanovorans]SHO54085.1 hypothetical protein SAMN02745217_04524 [Anaerocolumna xylanovorans DSM 12503]
MRRSFLVFAIICFTLMLCSCVNTGKKVEPLRTETVDFDINTAAQMVEKGEKIIADISLKDTVSRDEFKQFLTDMEDAYDGYKEIQWNYMFFYNDEFEDEHIATLHLNKDMFYPTIYHKDVEIVSAQVKNEYYEDETLNDIILTIREEYLGTDSKLKGWYRESLYKKNEEGKWVFFSFDGQMNFSDEGITSDYLKLK